jgi:hypothetical protein
LNPAADAAAGEAAAGGVNFEAKDSIELLEGAETGAAVPLSTFAGVVPLVPTEAEGEVKGDFFESPEAKEKGPGVPWALKEEKVGKAVLLPNGLGAALGSVVDTVAGGTVVGGGASTGTSFESFPEGRVSTVSWIGASATCSEGAGVSSFVVCSSVTISMSLEATSC